uniref:Uncharacterized protein n=1 Tax=Quercus lobata TaxID=97700 RepID=A0A7N2LWC8_QUELO
MAPPPLVKTRCKAGERRPLLHFEGKPSLPLISFRCGEMGYKPGLSHSLMNMLYVEGVLRCNCCLVADLETKLEKGLGEVNCEQELIELEYKIAALLGGLCGLTKSNFREPVNIGSEEMVSINEMADIVLSFETPHPSYSGPRRCAWSKLG